MTNPDIDPDKIPTLSDLVQPGTESKPRPVPAAKETAAPEIAENQLDMPLEAPAVPADETQEEASPTYGQPADDPFDTAIATAEDLLSVAEAGPTMDIPTLLDALEPRIEALVDSALERQARQTRDEIVSAVMDTLHQELTRQVQDGTSDAED